MKYQIVGNDFQILSVWLQEGEKIIAEAGNMIYMSDNIKFEARAVGGIIGLIKRMLAQESAFLTEFTSMSGVGYIAFGFSQGKIIPISLRSGQYIVAQKGSFFASTPGINIDIYLSKKLGFGILGGEGFILQKIEAIENNQIAFISAQGQVIDIYLQQNQILKINPGYLVAFEPSVKYNIEIIKGFKNILFGKEGLFLVTLKGPGRVWLQSIPNSRSNNHITFSLFSFMNKT